MSFGLFHNEKPRNVNTFVTANMEQTKKQKKNKGMLF